MPLVSAQEHSGSLQEPLVVELELEVVEEEVLEPPLVLDPPLLELEEEEVLELLLVLEEEELEEELEVELEELDVELLVEPPPPPLLEL